MRLDRNIVLSGVIAGFVCGVIVYVFTLLATVESLRDQTQILRESARISSDQIADLTYQLYQAKTQSEFVAMKDFIAGATDSLRRGEYYTEIWHNGYDRGVAVEAYARAQDEKAAYTSKD